MRTAMSRAQVESLCAAGIGGFQLGIETFSTPLLKLMNKGTTAVQNLQTLKWLSEAGAVVEWNLLYGFPGEDPADYAAMAEMLPSLYHLAPPRGCGRVRSDRFSPYFTHPEAFGIANLRPSAAFAHVFPFPPAALARLAYYFDFDYADGRRVEEYVGPLLERVAGLRELAGVVALSMSDRGDGVLLFHDTRPGAAVFQRRLSGLARERLSLLRRGADAGEDSRLCRTAGPRGGRGSRARDACGLDRRENCGLRGQSLFSPCPSRRGRGQIRPLRSGTCRRFREFAEKCTIPRVKSQSTEPQGRVRPMRDEDKSKEQLISELADLRRPLAEVRGVETECRRAEEWLAESNEEPFRAVFEEGPIGLVLVDPAGRVQRVNRRFCEMLGRSESEIVALGLEGLTHPDDWKRDYPFVSRLWRGEISHYRVEKRYLRKDGGQLWAQLTVSLLHDAAGRPVNNLGMVEDITERKQAEERLQKAHDELERRVEDRTNELSQANQRLRSEIAERHQAEGAFRREHHILNHMLQASDHERQVIAYEIHDGLAQHLAGAIMQFDVHRHLEETKPEDAEKAYDAGMTMLRQGHSEARRLIAGVRPPILDEEGIVAAIAHLANEHRRKKGPAIEYRSEVEFERLPPILENAVYRIAQEALANACGTAAARKSGLNWCSAARGSASRSKIGASDSNRTTLAKAVSDWREFARGRDSSAEKPASTANWARGPGSSWNCRWRCTKKATEMLRRRPDATVLKHGRGGDCAAALTA